MYSGDIISYDEVLGIFFVGIPCLVMQAREVPQHCGVVLYSVECSFLV